MSVNSSSGNSPDSRQVEGSEHRSRHSRSRRGCQTCKKQKKKCDEKRPRCSRCTAVDRECLWGPRPKEPTVSARTTQPPVIYNAPAGLSCTPMVMGNNIPTGLNNSAFGAGGMLTNAAPTDIFAPVLPDSDGIASDPFLEALFGSQPFDPSMFQDPIAADGGMNNGTNFPGSNQCNTDISDLFLQALSATELSNVNMPQAPLAVSADCDADLWSSFVTSSLWQEQPADDNNSLLEHYNAFCSNAIVIRDGPGSALRFYAECASRAKGGHHQGLLHAVLCLSSQHLSNWQRYNKDSAKAMTFADVSAQHRRQALHHMRVAAAKDDEVEEILPAVMTLLTLAAIIKGDGDVMPHFLQKTTRLLAKISPPTETAFLPTVTSLHSMYRVFHAITTGKHIDSSSLFVGLDDRPIWKENAKDTLETVIGIQQEVLLLLLQAWSLAIEFDTVSTALKNSADDEELSMIKMQLISNASAMEANLSDEWTFAAKYLSDGLPPRVRNGHIAYRYGIRALVQTRILGSSSPARIRPLVDGFLAAVEGIEQDKLIGMVWPLLILACNAPQDRHEAIRAYVARTQCRGSAGPRIAGEIIQEVWDLAAKGTRKDYMQCLEERGFPVLI